MRLIGLDTAALTGPGRDALLQWLDADLDSWRRARTWTVVVVTRPLFGLTVPDGRTIQALGDVFERGGVDLVIAAGGGGGYVRTLPFFGYDNRGRTRYITLPERDAAPEARMLEAGWFVALRDNRAATARLVADEGTLEWTAVDAAGRIIDSFRLDPQRTSPERPVSILAAASDAQDVVLLQREMLAVARQAARAVPDPSRPFTLPFLLSNPGRQTFSGVLRWEGVDGAKWMPERSDGR